ncbi:hypothetical protein BAOM_4688 [Peribacillus asahii]|uniref:BIG2 domain-containing protein n=2 Tax=Peribacillus asahii TaxID=228899 RepID=A0A3Q9RR10_9BACI|nr:hypothetical protein BAOM_4688 [Peribacillus asahii]
MGIDAEDGGVGGHGPISVYQNIVNSILAKVTNGGSGIFVFGANSYYVTSFWNAIATGTGQSVTFVNEANIETQSFAGYAMLAVSSDAYNTSGGLTQAQHDKLVKRQNDIASFINNGGGLLGFASDFTNPYAYLGAVGNISANINLSYSDVSPNIEGQAIGVTNDLDICCWHDEYTSYPDFLKVLATFPSGKAAVIGGLDVSVPSKLVVTPSNVSIAQGQHIPLKVTLDDGTIQKDVTAVSTGTIYSSNSPNVVVDDQGFISLLPEAQIGDTALITITHNGYTTTVDVSVDPPVEVVELVELSTSNDVLLGPGEKQQLNVNAVYSDGSKKDVTYAVEGTTYGSSVPESIFVSPNGMISISDTAPFGETGTITIKNQDKTKNVQVKITDPPTKLTVTPVTLDLMGGQTAQLKVIADFPDGTKKDVTKSSVYTSGNTSLAIVNNSGLVTIPKTTVDGTVTIRSTYAGLLSETVINVTPFREITDVQITPATLTIEQGKSQTVKVIASYSDGTTEDVTSKISFTSSNNGLATIDHHGVITVPQNAAGGTVEITGTYSGKTVKSVVTVPSKPILTSLIFTPDAVTLKPNETQQLKVSAEYSDGVIQDVTSQVVYESSNENLATVNSAGLISVNSNATGGTVYIRGSYGGKGGAATITIPSPPVLEGLTFTADKTTVKQGETTQVKVVANYSDGTTEDVTTKANLNSSNINQATVDPAKGIATITDQATGGTVYIRGSYGGKGGAVTLTIPKPPSVESLTFTPDKLTLKQGENAQIQVTATYSDGSTEDVTAKAGLNSSNTSQAAVDPATGEIKVLDSATGGTVYIRGSYGGKGGVMTLSVPARPSVVSLNFTPATKTVKPGDTVQMQVTANYSDGTTKDVTNQALLKSSNTSLATVDPSTGLVKIPTSASNGNVNIQGSYDGKGGAATITVSKPYIIGIAFTPNKVTLKGGDTLAMEVMATYSDGSTKDVTAQTAFSSSNTSLATVGASGVVTIANPTKGGTVYIRGTFSGKGAASTVTVMGPPSVTNLKFTPSTTTLKGGEILKMNVVAEYSDSTTEDVTAKVTYSSSNNNMAVVDNTGLVTVPTNAAPGTVYIRGSYNGKGGATTITILPKPSLVNLTFNPVSLSLDKGDTYRIKVTAEYSDGTSEDVTDFTTFSSSNINAAIVDNNGLITVPVNSSGGTVYIRGTYNGKGGATTVTIK